MGFIELDDALDGSLADLDTMFREHKAAGEFSVDSELGRVQRRTVDGVQRCRRITEIFSGTPCFMEDWWAEPGQHGDGI